jgi:hypothetical protein
MLLHVPLARPFLKRFRSSLIPDFMEEPRLCLFHLQSDLPEKIITEIFFRFASA